MEVTDKTPQRVSAPCGPLKAPAELKHCAEPPLLLPGENLRDNEVRRQMIVDDILLQTTIEWLWTLDLVEDPAVPAIEEEHSGRPSGNRNRNNSATTGRWRHAAAVMPMVHLQAKRTAAEWRDNPDAASETEARLRLSKFDNIDINAEVFIEARASFEMFDRLAQLAQSRRIGLLREIRLRREFARRARRVIGTLHGF